MIRLSLKPYDPIDSLIEFETLTNYLIVVKYFFFKYLWFVNFFDRAQSLTKPQTGLQKWPLLLCLGPPIWPNDGTVENLLDRVSLHFPWSGRRTERWKEPWEELNLQK